MRKQASAWAREEESKLDRIQAWQSPVSMHRLTLADLVRRYRKEEVPKKRGSSLCNLVDVLHAIIVAVPVFYTDLKYACYHHRLRSETKWFITTKFHKTFRP